MTLIKTETITRLMDKRTHARVMRDINRRIMLRHREKTLGKHYKDIPETRPGGAYGYVARSQRYLERKKKLVGHELPNVRSGKTKRFVRNNSRITATQHRGRFTARNYFAMKEQMRAELEAVSVPETEDMAETQQTTYVQEAAKPENQPKRKLRI